MLVQVLDFVACHVWVNTGTLSLSLSVILFRRGTPRPYILPPPFVSGAPHFAAPIRFRGECIDMAHPYKFNCFFLFAIF